MQLRVPLTLLLAAALASNGALADEPGLHCSYPPPGSSDYLKGLTYSFESLRGLTFNVTDPRSAETDTFSFRFGVCGAVPRPEGLGCSDVPNTAAWRVAREGSTITEKCKSVGLFEGPPEHRPKTFRTTLIPEINRPAIGARITYIGGEYLNQCSSNKAEDPVGKGTGSFAVTIFCSSSTNVKPDVPTETMVDELKPCEYNAVIESPAGCPLECMVDGELCPGGGICAYDIDAQMARCFPDSTSSCPSAKVTHSSGGAVGALFGGIFIGLLGVVAFWWYKHRMGGAQYRQELTEDEGYY